MNFRFPTFVSNAVLANPEISRSRRRSGKSALRAFGSFLILQMQRTAGSTGRIAAYNMVCERQLWAETTSHTTASNARYTVIRDTPSAAAISLTRLLPEHDFWSAIAQRVWVEEPIEKKRATPKN